MIDQANSDLKSFYDEERESAVTFFQSHLFTYICNAMGLNSRRIIRMALIEADEFWESVKQHTQEHENTGNNKSKKRKRKQSSKKYRLE